MASSKIATRFAKARGNFAREHWAWVGTCEHCCLQQHALIVKFHFGFNESSVWSVTMKRRECPLMQLRSRRTNWPLSLDETGRLRLMEGDDSAGAVAEQSGLPRVLQRFKADSQEIFIADRNRIREFRIETKTVDDDKDEQGKPKHKTVTKFREGKALEVGLKEWITSVALTDAALAVGTQQGTINVWDRSTQQRLGAFLAKP